LLLVLWKDSIDFVQLIKEQKEEAVGSLEALRSPAKKATQIIDYAALEREVEKIVA
jgi:hypothetical protein